MKYIVTIVLSLSLIGCGDIFEYHPYDTDVEDNLENINQNNIDIIQNIDSRDTLRFVFMGDTQRWYEETEDMVNDINSRSDIDFVIHGGDITDFGMKQEFIWIHEIMDRLNVPYVALPGNHDILGYGRAIYSEMYGDLNFEFIANRTKFVCLNTNALEFSYDTPVPDFDFIDNSIQDTLSNLYDNTIVVMHSQPYDIQFNNNVATIFQEKMKSFKGLSFLLHAHIHYHKSEDIFDDETIYYSCDAANDRRYMVFTVVGDKHSFELVEF